MAKYGASAFEQLLGGDARDRRDGWVDAQLILDELGDVGHRQLGGGVGATGACSQLVSVGAADRVAVMSVGDQHGVGRDRGRDGGDALRDR